MCKRNSGPVIRESLSFHNHNPNFLNTNSFSHTSHNFTAQNKILSSEPDIMMCVTVWLSPHSYQLLITGVVRKWNYSESEDIVASGSFGFGSLWRLWRSSGKTKMFGTRCAFLPKSREGTVLTKVLTMNRSIYIGLRLRVDRDLKCFRSLCRLIRCFRCR